MRLSATAHSFLTFFDTVRMVQVAWVVLVTVRLKILLCALKIDLILSDLIESGVTIADVQKLSNYFMTQSWGKGI